MKRLVLVLLAASLLGNSEFGGVARFAGELVPIVVVNAGRNHKLQRSMDGVESDEICKLFPWFPGCARI